jgi:hypothetical protein
MILNAWTQCNRLEMTQFKLLMVFAQDMQTPKCIRDLQLLFPLFEHDILPLIQVLAGESYSPGGRGGVNMLRKVDNLLITKKNANIPSDITK